METSLISCIQGLFWNMRAGVQFKLKNKIKKGKIIQKQDKNGEKQKTELTFKLFQKSTHLGVTNALKKVYMNVMLKHLQIGLSSHPFSHRPTFFVCAHLCTPFPPLHNTLCIYYFFKLVKFFTIEIEKSIKLPNIKLNFTVVSLKNCFYLNPHAAP